MTNERARTKGEGRAKRGLFRRDSDSGQLMLVAGIVITIAFLMTALTLSEVSTLEREAASDKPLPIADEWRFLHDRITANLQTAVASDTSASSFKTDVFPAIAATFRDVEAEKGYDAVFRLHSEAGLRQKTGDASKMDDYAFDGSTHFQQAFDSDTTDGVLLSDPAACPNNPGTQCIDGVYLLVHLSDGTTTMDEYVLVGVNQS